ESADGMGAAVHGNGDRHQKSPAEKLTALWKTFCGALSGTGVADADNVSGGSRAAAKNHALRRLVGQVCGVLAVFVLALFFTQTRLMYEVQPLGIALLCAAAPAGVAAAGGGVLLSLLAQGVGEGQVGSLYLGAAAVAVGMRYAVGRFLASPDADDRFGAANSRKRRQLRRYAVPGVEEDDGGPGSLAASLVRLGRAAFPSGVFAQSIAARVGISVLAAAPVAIGFLLGDAAGGVPVGRAVSVMAAVPAFTYLFCGIADGRRCPPALREAGIGAVCYALTASCGGAILFGFSVKLLAAHAITLAVSKRGGYLRGALTGLLCGFACDTLYAPAFALIGAAAGVLWNVHAAAAVLVSLAAGGAYAVYVGAFPAIRSVLPEMIVVSAAAYPLIRYLPDVLRRLQLPGFPSDAEEVPVQTHGTGEAFADGIAVTPELLGIPPLAVQLDALSGILRGLSSTFYHLSDRTRKPGLYEVRQLCEGISDRYCAHCAHHELCWEKEFSSTADAMGRITLCIHRKGRAEAGAAFAPLDRRCPNLPKMLAAMNDAAAVLCEEKITKDKTETAAGDYEGMAKLLRASAEESAQACKKDAALSRRLGRAMARIGFRAASVSVYGTRRRTVIAEGIDLGMGEAQDFLRRGGDLFGAGAARAAHAAAQHLRPDRPSGQGVRPCAAADFHAAHRHGN
ncbi:MAG: hypothetical protein IJ302_07940, partial [Clostridia bacterium]|nr:hypothetical protein [Clostridia bacterium]